MALPGQDYVDESDRFNFLSDLVNRGVQIDPNAQEFLNNYRPYQAPQQSFNYSQSASSQGYTQPTATMQAPQTVRTPVQQQSGPMSFGIDPGFQYEIQAREHSLQKYIADQNRRTQLEIAEINRAAEMRVQAENRRLQLELQKGQIDAQKYMQKRELVQRESEFARDLSLRQLMADRDNKIQEAQLELNKLGELRQERELHARLSANPQDTVAYEFFKRGMGGVQESWDEAQMMAEGAAGNQMLGTEQGWQTLTGAEYPSTAPAYSDETLQSVAENLFNSTWAPLWNPMLSGEGVFGAEIENPGQISRAEASNMTDAELGILQSFLKAGVKAPGANSTGRLALDPDEYFSQVQRSFIPTMSEATRPTVYR